MKVLHIETGKHLYGGAKQVQFLIEGLTKFGIENHLCCPRGADIASALPNAIIHFTDSAGDLDLQFYSQVKSILKNIKPDLAHLHSRKGADFLGALACKKTKTPCVLSRRVDNPENWLISRLKYPLYDHVITISEAIKRVLEKQRVPAKHISCVRSAVDFEKYQNKTPKLAFLRKFELPANATTIGVIAQLIHRKGHRYIIEIAQQLKLAHPNLEILIFGKGPKEAELKDAVKQNNLDKFIHFLGFHTDIHEWLGNIDIIAHPADMEGLGVALLQAASAGVPIVASKAGGIPEIVKDKLNGFLIPPGDTEALRKQLMLLLDNPEKRIDMGNTGKSIAKKEFSIATMVEGNLKIYKEVLSKTQSQKTHDTTTP